MRNSTSSQPFEPVDQDEPEHCRRLHSNFQAHWLAVEGYPGELETLRADNARLRRLLDLTEQHARAADPDQTAAGTPVDMRSSPEDKVRFYLDLFQCRQDVYAIRWEHRQDGRSGWMPAVREGALRSEAPYLPLTDDVVAAHLRGKHHIGLYHLG